MMTVTPRPSYRIKEVEPFENGLICRSEQLMQRFTVADSHMIEIAFTPLSEMDAPRICADVKWDWAEDESSITVCTEKVTLVICKADGKAKLYDKEKRLIFAEAERLAHTAEVFESIRTIDEPDKELEYIVTPDGKKPVVTAPKKVFDKKLAKLQLKFTADKAQSFYGLGQFNDGTYELRGKTVYLQQANMQIVIPFMISTGGYGIFFDLECPMIFDDSKSDTTVYAEAGQQFSYYVVVGDTAAAIKGYRALTGKAALLPKWTYGYLQSKECYESQEDLLGIIREYRRRNLPIDCVIQDWSSWPAGLWGQKSLDPERFPDPKQMTKELKEMNANWMISIWPNMAKGGDNYHEMKEAGFFLPNSDNYNAYDPDARALYWKQLKEGLYDNGAHAFWCDCSEPISPEWSRGLEPPASVQYFDFVRQAENFLPMEKSNSYGLYHAQAIYEGMRSVGNERTCNLTRSGYSGQQKYGAILWSGDTASKWETLKYQIASGLSFAASGMPWWTLDIGGFFAKSGVQWFWDGAFADPATNKGFWELYLRWFAYGAFLPIFRSHGTDVCREVWRFGEEGDPFYDALCKWLRLRYRLMPTIYSAAAACYFEDKNMIQGLPLCYPDDVTCRNISDEYLFADSILVCPVTEPMYYDYDGNALEGVAKTRKVYLPSGIWYDFATGEKLDGGRWIEADAKLDEQPMYVCGGSILVTGDAISYAEQKSEEYVITVYPGADADFVWYEDDGISYDYENENYTAIKLHWDDTKQTLAVTPLHGVFENRKLKLRVGASEICCELDAISGKDIKIG